jgi:hypothetical protein
VTRLRQQGLILKLFSYRNCDAKQGQALAAKARQAATVSAKPIYIFRELLQYLAEQRIVAPGYTLMQDTIGQALTYEQERLITILFHYLSASDVETLTRLLDDSPGLYEITLLPMGFARSREKPSKRVWKQCSGHTHKLVRLGAVPLVSNTKASEAAYNRFSAVYQRFMPLPPVPPLSGYLVPIPSPSDRQPATL